MALLQVSCICLAFWLLNGGDRQKVPEFFSRDDGGDRQIGGDLHRLIGFPAAAVKIAAFRGNVLPEYRARRQAR
ncbi:hypothetical protein VWX35_06875 [Phaeobacter sp. A36a-5a]|uniref:hypothetical protein n=1 Tax=Phaeobacter TaxID=302485 RepID=UPI003A846B96